MMRRSRALLATIPLMAVLLLLACPPAATGFADSADSLPILDDAYVDSGHPSSNHCEVPILRVGGDLMSVNGEQIAALRFDTSAVPPGSEVMSAELQLYLANTNLTYPMQLGVRRFVEPWSCPTLTYDTLPPRLCPTTVYGIEPVPGWKTFDVLPQVAEWVTYGAPNHGLCLFPVVATTGHMDFLASESDSGAMGPILTVTYRTGSGTVTITVEPTATNTATPTLTSTPTNSPTPTLTETPTNTPTPTSTTTTAAPTQTLTPTPTCTATQTTTVEPGVSATPSKTGTVVLDGTATLTPVASPSATEGPSGWLALYIPLVLRLNQAIPTGLGY
jgi:hypothetical protein